MSELLDVRADGVSDASVKVDKDIVYAVHDGVELLGDLYRPAHTTEDLAAVLLVHGGGWRGGSKERYASFGTYLAEQGYAAFSVNYRLAPKQPGSLETSTYPKNIWDIKAAVQWLRGEAGSLGIDGGRIAAMGSSSGGHLVAMLGLTGDLDDFRNPYPDPHADQSDVVSTVIPIAGVFDLIEEWERDLQRRPQAMITEWYLGGPFYDEAVRRRYYEASPVFHVSSPRADQTAWFVVYSLDDTTVTPTAQSLRFLEHLTRTKATVRSLPLRGESHNYITSDPGGFWTIAPRVASFLRAYL